MKNSIFKTFITGIFFSVLINGVAAQTFLFQGLPKEKTQFGLRFMRPTFKYGSDLSTLSGIYDFSLNIPINETLNFVGSIPYLTFAFEDNNTESGVGNIYFGLQTHRDFNDNNSSIGSFGLYFPTAKDDISGFFGVFTHFVDYHKYISDLLTIYGNYAHYNNTSQGVRFGLEIGPNLMIPTKRGYNTETELFIHYGITFGFQDENFAILTELIGLALITEDVDEFKDRFVHSIDFGFTYISNSVTPGIFYKLYLKEDFSDIVEGVLGIKIDITVH